MIGLFWNVWHAGHVVNAREGREYNACAREFAEDATRDVEVPAGACLQWERRAGAAVASILSAVEARCFRQLGACHAAPCRGSDGYSSVRKAGARPPDDRTSK